MWTQVGDRHTYVLGEVIKWRQVGKQFFWRDKASGGQRLCLWLSYKYDKHRRNQLPRSSYHNLQLQWVIASTNVATDNVTDIPSKHDINGPFVVSVKATNGRNGSMASHFLPQMARFSVAIFLPFKACHEPAVNGPLQASHFSAI